MAEDHYKRYEGIHFPQTKLLLQTKEGTLSFLGPPSIIPPHLDQSSVLQINPDDGVFSQPEVALSLPPLYSADGMCLARAPADKSAPIEIVSTESGAIISIIPCTDAQSIEFSPLGTFLVTWSRQLKPKSGEAPQCNLHVWRVSSGELEASFNQRQMQSDMIQRRLAGHPESESLPQRSLAVQHSPNPAVPIIAVFTPEAGGKHAKVMMYSYDQQLLSEEGAEGTKAQGCQDTGFGRTMFAANECCMKWNLSGERVIVQTQSDVDSSNASYYGSTGLFLLSVDGKVSLKVPQSKEGHVAAAEWSPTGEVFIMAAGNMPCQVTMFNNEGDAVYEFGAMHRNTISFAPHGRFLCLAGFGNLAGDMDFYDFSGNKRKKIGSANSHCAVKWAWSPDSRYFMTSTLRPRMNVDNGIKLFKYNGLGGALVDYKIEYLYDAQWKPALLTAYPDRSRSPSRPDASGGSSDKASTSKPAAVAAYRPPGSSGALSEMMRRSSGPKGKVVGGSVSTNNGGSGQQKSVEKFVPSAARRPIPGLPPTAVMEATSSGSKNSRKRNKGGNKSAEAGKGEKQGKAPVLSVEEKKVEEVVVVDKEKKIKNLRKKLKQVTELKGKQASGENMNPDQLKKIETEGDILKELALLEV
eukprot:CAMPEP_0114415412 /NCGR_PEP_ID=MMETSP0103-20121206/1897_1 /TAXON_ID=37642 ORGANISM="Paraphysomonas imperforata, Strain PA2" /NCGR_SAMPLE_ID=MMETSP0103 /ASSEMBLY_ACC=CAM_ASM_000201 /LENGTH=636 /DNA_ID=CAMNT_0001583597 /DNA_START=45 /DNA_END=1956 /DNA_ORIENTATION=+